MVEWFFEVGVGENRAVCVAAGGIVEAVVELPGGLRAGSVVEARLTAVLAPRVRGIVALPGGEEGLIEPLPDGVTEGAMLRVEIVREAIGEVGRPKRARVRASREALRNGPGLAARIGKARRVDARVEDVFEAAGWSELLDEARSGEIAFAGGALRMSVTPAITLFDVDGVLPPPVLAVAGAAAAGRAIRRLGISGSIGIDLPTLGAKTDRLAAAAALDAVLPQPFERTAVNGFGFLQVVRRRERASIPEIIQGDLIGAAARALLRQAERGTGAVTLVAAPTVIARIEREAEWTAMLAQRVGGAVALSPDPMLAIWAGYAHQSQG